MTYKSTPTTHLTILEVIQRQLLEKLPGFTEETCFISDDPVPLTAPADTFITIWTGDTDFPEEYFSGGGTDQLTEAAPIVVTAYRRALADPPNVAQNVIADHEEGLLGYYKPALLRALLKDEWSPTFDGAELLRDQLRPTGTNGPRSVPFEQSDGSYWGLGIAFALLWDWELD